MPRIRKARPHFSFLFAAMAFVALPSHAQVQMVVNFSVGGPTDLVARLEQACERTVRSPAVVQGMQKVAQPILCRNGSEFGAFSRSESEKFRALITSAGLRSTE